MAMTAPRFFPSASEAICCRFTFKVVTTLSPTLFLPMISSAVCSIRFVWDRRRSKFASDSIPVFPTVEYPTTWANRLPYGYSRVSVPSEPVAVTVLASTVPSSARIFPRVTRSSKIVALAL